MLPALLSAPLWALDSEAATEPYVDRLIDGGNLAPIISLDIDAPQRNSGLPRQWSVTLRASKLSSDDAVNVNATVRDVQISGQVDTPLYGAWSVALTQRDHPRALFGRIDQRAMPFDNGWQLDNAWGMVTTVGERAASALGSRFTLPTMPIFGMHSAWSNPNSGQSLAVAVGERYQTGDAASAGFQRLGGRFLSAAVASPLTANLRATVSAISATESEAFDPLKLRVDSALASLSWNVSDAVIAGNVMASRQPQGARAGLWIDAQWADGPFEQRVSAFRFDRDLMWGNSAAISDIEGVGYRLGYRSRVINADVSAELFHPLSRPNDWGIYGTGSLRYRLSQSWGAGGNTSLRVQGGTAFTLRAYIDNVNALGQTQLQVSHDQSSDRSTRSLIGLDHSFASFAALTGARLTLSSSIEHMQREFSGRSDWINLAGVLGYEFSGGFSFDATLRNRESIYGARTRALDAAANVAWRFSPGWSVAASFGLSRGRFELLPSLDPLQPVVLPFQRVASRYMFASITYRFAGGGAEVPLGGRAGGPAGSVSGVVFLDDNDNDRRDANELGAANVMVLLDGRFSTRTDAQGRFEFALVGSGEHKITVPAESLPLPWTIVSPTVSVRVESRTTSSVSIAATRIR